MTLVFWEKAVIWFMVYCFIGWVWETLLFSVEERRFVNRGFLNGPYCPIYGCGALLDVLFFGRLTEPVAIFFLTAVTNTAVEYLTSYAMEKLFHARWWDYSERRFNLHGRVCLIGFLVFGAFSLGLILYLHPALVRLTDKLSPLALHIVSGLFAAVFVTDLVITLTGFSGFNEKLSGFSKILTERYGKAVERVQSSAAYAKLSETYAGFARKLNFQQLRMLRSFPALRSVSHNNVLRGIKAVFLRKDRDADRKGPGDSEDTEEKE